VLNSGESLDPHQFVLLWVFLLVCLARVEQGLRQGLPV
jgi:hypothetical protein